MASPQQLIIIERKPVRSNTCGRSLTRRLHQLKSWAETGLADNLGINVRNVLNRKNEYNVESTLLLLARTGQFTSGLRTGFRVAPSIGLSVQF